MESRLEKGKLILEAREEQYGGSPYTSAKLTTARKGEWTYGRFDIRARLPEGRGIWPAIWMMPADMDLYGGWPSCGEIDIMELVGHEPDTVYGTLHYGNPWKYTGDQFRLGKGIPAEDGDRLGPRIRSRRGIRQSSRKETGGGARRGGTGAAEPRQIMVKMGVTSSIWG